MNKKTNKCVEIDHNRADSGNRRAKDGRQNAEGLTLNADRFPFRPRVAEALAEGVKRRKADNLSLLLIYLTAGSGRSDKNRSSPFLFSPVSS